MQLFTNGKLPQFIGMYEEMKIPLPRFLAPADVAVACPQMAR